MATILVNVQIEDFEKFWPVFSSRGMEMRRRHGSQGAQVFRNTDDPKA